MPLLSGLGIAIMVLHFSGEKNQRIPTMEVVAKEFLSVKVSK